MTTQAALYPAGLVVRCPIANCRRTLTCVGLEVAVLCDGGGRHRIVKMEPVVDAASRERDGR